MKVNIINSGYGNIGSVINMFKKIGIESTVCNDYKDLKNSSHIILPGVGSFDSGIHRLKESGFYDVIKNDVKKYQIPLLGICLGMQFLFQGSEEGKSNGLGLIPDKLEKFNNDDTKLNLKIPHMGWNYVSFDPSSRLGEGFEDNSRFYFVHSFCCKKLNRNYCHGSTEYGITFTSVVENENFFGVQFHPEKSLSFGIKLFKNFLKC